MKVLFCKFVYIW